jgi:hypothetical protein
VKLCNTKFGSSRFYTFTQYLLQFSESWTRGSSERQKLVYCEIIRAHSQHAVFLRVPNCPELSKDLCEICDHESENWQTAGHFGQIAQILNDSAKVVRDAVQARVNTGQDMKGANVAYDHPILLLQHMLWHEGYHVGQMMLALKAAGSPMTDEKAVPVIWSAWVHEW